MCVVFMLGNRCAHYCAVQLKTMTEADKSIINSMEYRILQAMKRVLTDVIKDTTTKPGMIHPLSDQTIEGIRECLQLITARERELHEAAGASNEMRPHYIDEPPKSVAIPLSKIGKRKKKNGD
jgi:hypothetical protein